MIDQIDTLQIPLKPIRYTAYFWATATVLMTAACIASKTVDALKKDWERIQLRKTYKMISATPYRDLRRIAKYYGLVPTSQKKADLIVAIYNFHQQQHNRAKAIATS